MSRISELPRRDWKADALPFVEHLSAALRAPGGKRTLRLGQAAALLEARNGLVKQGRVGTGKTTTLSLLPTVLGCSRPLYMTAGGVLKDTRKEIDNEVRPHWRIPADLELLSYTALSNFPRQGKTFRDIWPEGPDIFLCDEAQNLAGVRTAACAKQVQEWIQENPDTLFCSTTGSFDLDGLPSYAHIFDWSLRDRSPVPRTPHEVAVWHEVIDEGELGKIWQVAEQLGQPRIKTLDGIREVFRDRVLSTPGVIVDDTPFTAVPLTVKEHFFDPGLEAEFQKLRELGQRPDGFDVLPAAVLEADPETESDEPDRVANGSVAETARQLASGFFYKLWPAAPPEWLAARRKYFKHVRRLIDDGLFLTEAQVRADAIANNRAAWTEWAAAQPTFTPRFHTAWLSDNLVDWVNDWSKQGPGVVWTEHIAVGLRLEEKLGLTYYGGRGRSSRGDFITAGPRPSQKCVIASRKANFIGRNLQFQWDRCLFTQAVGRSYIFEQAVGRFHREGVEGWSKNVHADVLMRCTEDWRARQKLLHKAEATTASLYAQKAGSVPWEKVSRPSDGWAFQ